MIDGLGAKRPLTVVAGLIGDESLLFLIQELLRIGPESFRLKG
ncbi:hypothetical protein B0F87_10862 [Methylobacter tundripaludum]|uniref:Uncharacterized protein n=1 Tax=Methylobacter tundripaludum TaxID=173365 RepID=A0A2S6HAV2_9GAMM|nr:hypothetical protein B0F87_10862 [Methylobacter tundripaludum]